MIKTIQNYSQQAAPTKVLHMAVKCNQNYLPKTLPVFYTKVSLIFIYLVVMFWAKIIPV